MSKAQSKSIDQALKKDDSYIRKDNNKVVIIEGSNSLFVYYRYLGESDFHHMNRKTFHIEFNKSKMVII